MNELTVFSAALERQPGERSAFLDEACAADEKLRQRVEILLRHHDQAGSFLESPAADWPPTIAQGVTEEPGSQIGPYKVLQHIGEGGMGVVFMAEQTEPVERRVALKIIKPGMDTRQVIARFDAERQALAMMDHPNIARVLDAGRTDSGRPYFVMELVKGVPVTQYCDEQHLTLRQRLELFLPVCQAIQHAHQKGVIHRDIKPSNVLVALFDGRPVPKVIDFGVAKATGGRLTEKTLFTQFGQIIGTLEYMSPEQAQLNQLDVDTRSDVYSLGVLLYELLTGSTPFDKRSWRDVGFDEIRRIIREDDPPRPSDRLSTLAVEALSTVSGQRRTAPRQLSLALRGELDWIVMKALEKDRNRRYESPSALAADLQRYLNDEPVQACPPSTWYRLRKLVRKNRIAAMVSALVAVLLVVVATASIVVAWQASELVHEREEKGFEQQRRIAALQRESQALQDQAALDRQQRLTLAFHQWETGNVREADGLLDGISFSYRDWTWNFLRRLCHSEAAFFTLPEFQARDCRFSSSGHSLIVTKNGGGIAVWDVAAAKQLLATKEQREVYGAALDGPGYRVAIPLQQGDIEIRDVEQGETYLLPLGDDSGRIKQTAFAAANDRIAVATDGRLSVWDLKTRTRLFETEILSGDLKLAIAPDGRLAAVMSQGALSIWDIESESPLHQIDGFGRAAALGFDPDQSHIAVVGKDPRLIRLIDLNSGETVHRLQHTGQVNALAFDPSGNWLAAGGEDNQVSLWDLSTGVKVRTIRGPRFSVVDVAFDEQGERLFTVDGSGEVKTWDHSHEQLARVVPAVAPWGGALSPDGKTCAIASLDTFVRTFDVESGALEFSEMVNNDAPWAVAFSPVGSTFAVGTTQGSIVLYDNAKRKRIGTLPAAGYDWSALTVAFSPDGKHIAAGGQGRNVSMWDVNSGQKLFERDGHLQSVTKVVFSRDGKLLVSGSGGTLQQVHGRGPDGLPLPRDEQWHPGDIKIWDAATGKLLHSIGPLDGKTEGLAISADGKTIATTFSDGSVRLYDAASGKQVRTLRGHSVGAWVTAFHPTDSRCLVSADEVGTIKVWDAQLGREIITLGTLSINAACVEFSGDGRRLITVGMTQDVRIWDATPLPQRPKGTAGMP